MNIKIILAQLNFTVGDIEGNKNKIIDAILKNQSNNISTVIIFPELSICSYPPEDLLHRPAFLQRIEVALNEIVNATKEIYVLVGYPKKSNGKIFNACSVIYNGEIIKTYFKQILPNYGVFDEKRYFEAGNSNCLFDINGISIAVTICEDIWEQQPTKNAADAGARILFNLNASPYHITKKQQRETLIKQRARENNLHIAYINLVGGQDELIFDGYSMLINANGENIFAAPQFTEGLYSYELDIENKEITNTVAIVDTPVTEEASIYQALVLGVRDYVKKNNFSGVVIGLSGGIDSALTTTIAVDGLGAENVEVLIMPSRYTAQMSINDAIKQADTLGIRHETISIEPAFNSFLGSLFNRFENLPTDITEENIQGGISKIQAADNVLGFIPNSHAREVGIMRAKFLKTRDSGGVGAYIDFKVDWSTLTFAPFDAKSQGDGTYMPQVGNSQTSFSADQLKRTDKGKAKPKPQPKEDDIENEDVDDDGKSDESSGAKTKSVIKSLGGKKKPFGGRGVKLA